MPLTIEKFYIGVFSKQLLRLDIEPFNLCCLTI